MFAPQRGVKVVVKISLMCIHSAESGDALQCALRFRTSHIWKPTTVYKITQQASSLNWGRGSNHPPRKSDSVRV